MKRFARALTVMFGIVVLSSLVLFVPHKNATAQSGPAVTITSPLPLPVKGNVSATVSGTVAAQQSGSWNVGITGTPAVSVGNFPSTQLVTFSNISSTPLFVDTDAPARSAVSGECIASTTGSGSGGCDLVSVPSGKTLVVDGLSAEVDVSAGKAVLLLDVLFPATDVSGTLKTVHYVLPVKLIGSDGIFDRYQFGGPFTLYVPADSTIRGGVSTTDLSGNGVVFLSFSGHLVTP